MWLMQLGEVIFGGVGSGLYGMAGLSKTKEVKVKTPFGDPSDAVIVGTLAGSRVAFLPRHGRGLRADAHEASGVACSAGGRGYTRNVASRITPSVPWEPR